MIAFLTAWFQARTRRSVIYLLLRLPLGIAYFAFLVTGFPLRAGLVVIYERFPVLALPFLEARLFCRLEVGLANALYGADIVQPPAPWSSKSSMQTNFKRTLYDQGTWDGVVFLFVMFPLGIATFTISVTLVAVAFGGPIALIWSILTEWNFAWQLQAVGGGVTLVVGMFLVFATPHLLNALASVQSRFVKAMLSDPGAVGGR